MRNSLKTNPPLWAVCLLLVTFAIGGCTTSQAPGVSSTGVVYFSSKIEGEVEPCGCRTNPLGGIHRRAAAIPLDALYLIAGDTFFRHNPLPLGFEELALAKAKVLGQSFRSMGARRALAPGYADFAKGLDYLRARAEDGGLLLVAANLRGFSASFDTLSGTRRVKVFGYYSPSLPEPFPNGIDRSVTPQSLSASIRSARRSGAFTVLLTNQSFDEAMADWSGADLVISGGDSYLPNELQIKQSPQGASMHSAAFYGGQYLGRVYVPSQAADQYVDQTIKESASKEVLSLKEKETNINYALGNPDLPADARPILLAELERIRELINRWEQALNPKLTPISWNLLAMDTNYEQRDHPSYTLLQKLRLELNDLSLTAMPTPPIDRQTRSMVTPESCINCHQAQVQFWESTLHSSALVSLWNKASHQNIACIQCHSVGVGTHWNLRDGPFEQLLAGQLAPFPQEKVLSQALPLNADINFYEQHDKREQAHAAYWASLRSSKVSANFAGVSCVNCHGEPTSEHTSKGTRWKSMISPQVCLDCHNSENSARFIDHQGNIQAEALKKAYQKMSCPPMVRGGSGPAGVPGKKP